MVKQCIYAFLCLLYLTMTSSTFTSQNDKITDLSSRETMVKMLVQNEQVVKDCAFCLHFPYHDNSYEVYYYSYLTPTNKNSFIRAERIIATSHTDFEVYLDKTIDPQLPDHVEIICGKNNALTVNFYKKTKQIINGVILLRWDADAFKTMDLLLDVKGPHHPLKNYSSPSTFLDQVKKVTYKNSFYPKKILIYTGDHIYNISNSWQENGVQIIKCISISIVLYLLLKKCRKYKK